LCISNIFSNFAPDFKKITTSVQGGSLIEIRHFDDEKIGLLMNVIILAANILIVNPVYPLTPLP